ncbi:MAG: PIN domain-containing protein [Rhizobiaceae bacterium]|nr:PIN domain-containing protein [Rhizobiaceae bacterium]
MRHEHFEFYTPSKDEFDALWKDALFVFDANVLLSLLRYKQAAKNEIIGLMERIKERMWIPHQVSYEFLKNRHKVFFGLEKPYSDIEAVINEQITQFNTKIDEISKEYRYHPSIEFDSIKSTARDAMKEIERALQKFKQDHPSRKEAESMLESVTTLFKERVGKGYSEADRARYVTEAANRNRDKIPPGFADGKKDDGGVGDYLIWSQMMDKARETKRPIIFITEDVKDDWWLRVSGQTIGPLPALRREFYDRTDQHFYAYRVVEFLKHSHTKAITQVSDKTLKEAAQVAKSRDAWVRRNQYRHLEHLELIERELYALNIMRQNLLDERVKVDVDSLDSSDETVKIWKRDLKEIEERISELSLSAANTRHEIELSRNLLGDDEARLGYRFTDNSGRIRFRNPQGRRD